MSDPYIGEIRMFAGIFAPLGWNFCDGSLISIAENSTLYQLIGTTYGGDGVNTFALPDLRGRVPMHQGGGNVVGQKAGVEEVTLLAANLPQHTHTLSAATSGQVQTPVAQSSIPAVAASSQTGIMVSVYGNPPGNATLNPSSTTNDGGSQPHSNIQPYLAVNFIIAMAGTYPSQ
jgi:microcystin-dependent protein